MAEIADFMNEQNLGPIGQGLVMKAGLPVMAVPTPAVLAVPSAVICPAVRAVVTNGAGGM